ncbi:MAG: hypothetical protein ACRDIV_20330 [Ktedonobacteraceae bacterium]
MGSSNFSIGDLPLFIYYLAFVTDFTGLFGMLLAYYHQTGVPFERMMTLLQGAAPQMLVKRARREALRRAGPAHGSRAYVRARPPTTGMR